MTQFQRKQYDKLNSDVSNAFKKMDQNTDPNKQQKLNDGWLKSNCKLESFTDKVFQ